jgi:DNA integrity scanning protein DisA with diadenylate cyclase activity
MSAAAEDGVDEHVPPSVLHGMKEELLIRDLINRMEIADGLKGLLISSGFTVKSLLNTSASDLAKILGIDEYVAKLLTDAINKAIKSS